MKIATALLFLALGATSATAQIPGPSGFAPRLKAQATVSGDIVRIGDLVENAGVLANTAIFRAPDLGQTGAVPVRQVLDSIRPYGLIAVGVGGLTEISVTRAAHNIAADDIEARIVRALIARYNLGAQENLKIMFDREVRSISLDLSMKPELSLARLNYDSSSRRFDVTFELASGAVGTWRYAGTAVETVEAAVPNRAFNRGDIIKASDFTVERRPKSEFGNEAPATSVNVAGLAAKRAVRAGQPLRAADLMKAEIVQRNDMVTLHYEMPGLMLTIRGKSLDSGAEGDTVNVLNPVSKRTLQATVTAPGHVTVASTTHQPRLAARTETAEQTR